MSERLLLLRWMQTFSSVSFLFNLITIFCVFVGLYNFALNFFIISVVFLILAIILFIIEIDGERGNDIMEIINILIDAPFDIIISIR